MVHQHQICCTCAILHQIWKHCGSPYLLLFCCLWEVHPYKNQRGGGRMCSCFCSSDSHSYPPAQEKQASAGSQSQLTDKCFHFQSCSQRLNKMTFYRNFPVTVKLTEIFLSLLILSHVNIFHCLFDRLLEYCNILLYQFS